MSQQSPGGFDEWWWAEPTMKQRLLRDPASVVKEYGLNVPDNLNPEILHDVVRIVSLLWVDGKIVPREQFHIDPCDEGLLFGKGVWESTRTFNSFPWLWAEHIDRLKRTAALLEIDVAPQRLPDAKTVSDFVRMLCATDIVIRLNVTAGRPGKAGMVWMNAWVLPFPKPSFRLKSTLSPDLKGQPYLAWKTFQYASRLRTGQLAAKGGAFDTALMLDPNGTVLEAAHANIFFRFPDGWATPAAENELLLPGTVRQYLLKNSPLPIKERTIARTELANATEVFVTNSNVGIIPVSQIDDLSYPTGPETKTLVDWVHPK